MEAVWSHELPERVARPERPQVFVCGDLHNLGDLKLLLQNLALTDGCGGIVRRWAPLPEAVVKQVEDAGGTLFPGKAILRFARLAWGTEIVLGGGQLVRDNVSLAALFGLLLAAASARLGGGRLVTRGLGISRIRSPLRRWLWRAVLMLGGTVNLRDHASAGNLRSLLRRKAHAVNADMAFLSIPSRHAIVPVAAARRWIVVAPCVDGSEGRSPEGAALDAVVQAALARLSDARLVIACHDPRAEMDKAVAARLAAHWHPREVVVMGDYELSDLIVLYQQAALVVTNRLHALIFAILADAPALAVEDGTAKVGVVADRFAIPILHRHDAGGAGACVDAALAFDPVERARERCDAARRAAGNL